MSEARESLEKQVKKAIFTQSIIRWESAVLISLTIAATAFGSRFLPQRPNWGWLVGGLLGEAGLVYSSLTDPEWARKVVAGLLQKEFRPDKLKSKPLQAQIEKALDYRSRINKLIRERSDSLLKDKLQGMAGQFDDWIEEIYILAKRLDSYLLERKQLQTNQRNAEERMAQLKHLLLKEDDAKVREEIETNIEGMQRQIETIETLDNTMARAQLRLENTLTAMGTIYPQTMLLGAKDIDSNHYAHLEQEISDEVD